MPCIRRVAIKILQPSPLNPLGSTYRMRDGLSGVQAVSPQATRVLGKSACLAAKVLALVAIVASHVAKAYASACVQLQVCGFEQCCFTPVMSAAVG